MENIALEFYETASIGYARIVSQAACRISQDHFQKVARDIQALADLGKVAIIELRTTPESQGQLVDLISFTRLE